VPEPSEGLASRAGAARRQDLVWSGQVGRIGSVPSLDPATGRRKKEWDAFGSGPRVSVPCGISCRPFHSTFHSRVCHSACAVVPADFCWGTVFFCRAIYCVEAGIHRIFLIHSMECYVGTP
jgi:hypothetical protein